MSEADRIAELEARIAALEGRSSSIERAERELLDAARQWARSKQLGHYIEGGLIVRLGAGERASFENYFANKIQSAALALLDIEAKPRQ